MTSPAPADPVSAWSESEKTEFLQYLERLTALPAFAASPRRCQLLRYLVERKLAGQAEKLNEYAIGLDVLEKPQSFDPRLEAAVRVQVSRLRRILADYYRGEGAGDPWRIELPARGYVPSIGKPAPLPVEDGFAHGPEQARARRRPAVPRLPLTALVLAGAIFLTGLGGYESWRREHAARAPRSLALVPFANLSPDPANDYFIDGLADEVTVMLGQIKNLRVIARSSTSKFRHSKETPRELGRQLGVDAVLSGSLQRSGDRVRVIVQLNSTGDGSQIWSEAFDGAGRDSLSLEDHIAGAVASRLGASIATRAAKDPAVHDLYLRGRFFATQQTPAAVLRARELFQQGLARDANDAECLRGLAAAEVWLANMGQEPAEKANRAARALVEKAVAADPNDGMGHLMLGYVLYSNDRNWRAAEPEFQKAVELSPNSPDVRNNYGYMLMYRGRFDEAQVQFVHGREIDPLSIMPHVNLCELYANMGDYPHGEAECRKVLDANPKHLGARVELAEMLAMEGKYDAAFEQLDRAREVMVNPEVALSLRAGFLARQGKTGEARKVLRELESNPGPPAWVMRAGAYLEFGDLDKAFDCLEKAFREHDGNLLAVPVEPLWAGVRSDPRFQDLVRRMAGQ